MDIQITGSFIMSQEQYDKLVQIAKEKGQLNVLETLNITISNPRQNDKNISN